ALQAVATVIKTRKEASTRKYSLQQATLSILGGAASCTVLYYFLNHAVNSGFVTSVINSVTAVNPKLQLGGLEQVVRLLWVFGLIGIAKGVGHLINAVFLGPSKEIPAPAPPLQPAAPAPPVVATDSSRYVATPSTSATTNELENSPQSSVTE